MRDSKGDPWLDYFLVSAVKGNRVCDPSMPEIADIDVKTLEPDDSPVAVPWA